jgi:putative oxidoreductase
VNQGGFEYNLVLATVAVAVGLSGPGSYSLDAAVGWSAPAPWTFLIGLTSPWWFCS